MPFSSLPAPLSAALAARGYAEPTAVQAAVLDAEALGRDLLVSARTGSGKTVAFGMAMGGELLDESNALKALGRPAALIIAPTRELALQVSRELEWLYHGTFARIATCVGGMDPSKERRFLSQGADIVVGTPGRLRDHFERGVLDLGALRVAVLDEADEMLDMGFREDLEEILDATPQDRRTMLFSATIPKPIETLARRYQKNALRISTVGDDRGHGDIDYQAVAVPPSDIENVAINLLRYHEAETAILFCATRDSVRHLHASLIERGFSAVALSGEHSQSERNQALQALRDGRARVCVATDVAARGIDLPSLSLVIHVEIPRDADTLQHRSGRTGRAGRKGTAVLIVPYPRRRRVESMLRTARISLDWVAAPTRDDVRIKDRERLLASLMQPVEADDEDRALAQRLIAERSADDIATMLVQAFRAKMPQPEELIDSSDAGAKRDQGPRPGFEDTIWFRLDVGRNDRADARWILPLLCRRGHITRGEVGAIRILSAETMFEIPRAVADRFAQAVERTAGEETEEGGVTITRADGPPREAARQNRKQGHRGSADAYKPRPVSGRDHTARSDHPAKAPGGKFGKKPFVKGDAPRGRPGGPAKPGAFKPKRPPRD